MRRTLRLGGGGRRGLSDWALPKEVFGSRVFDAAKMRSHVGSDVYAMWQQAVAGKGPLTTEAVSSIAWHLQRWAVSHGVSHFTHWFQPLNGGTAEKHRSFRDIDKQGQAVSSFGAAQLLSSEVDASSFPSGNLRKTHEARGLATWDPSSPPFILTQHWNGNVLYIPSIFTAGTKVALDHKLPLLRSITAVENQCLKLLGLIGDKGHTKVQVQVGIEQEFFLVDRNDFLKRPDLRMTGRTLVGSRPAKHQQMEDHYCSSINDHRVCSMLHNVEFEANRLGIMLQVRHSEVAPGQYEVVPRFADANVAVDQNHLLRMLLKRAATSHGLTALFHEKPFAGINGSGKHVNWSIGTNLESSLLEADDLFSADKKRHVRFSLLMAAVLRAVDLNADLLRLSVCGTGNDHRLGGYEAPPAIMSVCLGKDITQALYDGWKGSTLGLVPSVDRNRTSPFAYNGNKFEFRAVGASQNPSVSTQFLNTAVADSLAYLNEEIQATTSESLETTLNCAAAVAHETIVRHSRIIFNGNGYEWRKEAEARGLLHYPTTTDALFLKPKKQKIDITMFSRLGVMTPTEFAARMTVWSHEHVERVNAEANLLINMAQTLILPAAHQYLHTKSSIKRGDDANKQPQPQPLLDSIQRAEATILAVKAYIWESENVSHESLTLLSKYTTELRVILDGIEAVIPANSHSLPTYHDLLHSTTD